jgi:hypothetical protein
MDITQSTTQGQEEGAGVEERQEQEVEQEQQEQEQQEQEQDAGEGAIGPAPAPPPFQRVLREALATFSGLQITSRAFRPPTGLEAPAQLLLRLRGEMELAQRALHALTNS